MIGVSWKWDSFGGYKQMGLKIWFYFGEKSAEINIWMQQWKCVCLESTYSNCVLVYSWAKKSTMDLVEILGKDYIGIRWRRDE